MLLLIIADIWRVLILDSSLTLASLLGFGGILVFIFWWWYWVFFCVSNTVTGQHQPISNSYCPVCWNMSWMTWGTLVLRKNSCSLRIFESNLQFLAFGAYLKINLAVTGLFPGTADPEMLCSWHCHCCHLSHLGCGSVPSCGSLIHMSKTGCEGGQLFMAAIYGQGTSQSSLEIVLVLSGGEIWPAGNDKAALRSWNISMGWQGRWWRPV